MLSIQSVNRESLRGVQNTNPQKRLPPQEVFQPGLTNSVPLSVENLKANFLSFKGNARSEAEKLTPEYKDYIQKLENIENGRVLDQAFSTLKESGTSQKKDFLKTCAELNILNKNDILLLAKIASKMKGGSKLEYGLNIQDNWLERVITNPHFSERDKINTIIRSCKSQEMGQVVKRDNLFLNGTSIGNISGKDNFGSPDLGESKAYGLFTNDTQFLSNYELSVSDKTGVIPLKLVTQSNEDGRACYKLLGPDGISIDRTQITSKGFYDRISLKNDSEKDRVVKIDLESQIRDIMDVRSMTPGKGPYEVRVTDDGRGVILNTEMAPGRTLGVKVEFLVKNGAEISPLKPVLHKDPPNSLSAKVRVPGSEAREIYTKVIPILNNEPFVNGQTVIEVPENFQAAEKDLAKSSNTDFSTITLEGKNNLKNAGAVLNQSINDLKLLTNKLNIDEKEYSYIGAGLPRYACLFGRDSILTAIEVLPLNQKLALDTIELLAKYQGKTFEDRFKVELSKPEVDVNKLKEQYQIQEEAEGKILHELRVGELAREHKIPSTPYYGTVDATPLWLMLISDYHNWSSDNATVKKLLPQIEKALEWIDKNSPDGFLRFVGSDQTKHSIANQGWKDSEDSIKHIPDENGKIQNPKYPIALAEVQGYVYAAKKGIAELYRKLGKEQEAQKLDKQAAELKERFNEKYWVDGEKFIAIALDADGKAVPSVTTNAGQCLSTGIIDNKKAESVKKRLMGEDMNSGWGIRTLSKKSPAFDEMSYHNGSVWPHDTALVARGLDHKDTASIATNLYEAASTFEHNRIPELYAGFQRRGDDICIQTYPEGCSPQAWSAAGLVNVILSTLGIQPNSQNNSIKLVNPVLPENIDSIKIDRLLINGKQVALKINRQKNNTLEIKATTGDKEIPVKKDGHTFVITPG